MLDSAYRPSLARLISELSKETQFIVTSHCRDILDYGDQFYGVKNINQVSKVCCSAGVKTLNVFPCFIVIFADAGKMSRT
jgi:Chromosome segregation ATPases